MSEKSKILIVDDDAAFAESMKDILEDKGYQVSTEKSGHLAVPRVEKEKFDVVLMDIKMPVLTGVDAFKKIKEISPDTKVIMMTAFAVEDMIRESLKEGAFGCLHKPFDIERMVEQIDIAQNDGMMVLVTDDDPGIRETFKDILEEKKYKVSVTKSGEEAIKLAEERPHDILFIDLQLPALNGLETYLRIKAINPNVVAIIITGHKQELGGLIDKALEEGAYACMTKPLEMDNVLKVIDDIAKKKHKKEV